MIYCGGSQKLQVYLGGAVTTTELPWILTAITTGDVVAARNGVTTGATAVDVCNAADGLIRHLEVYNADTVSATIYVRYNDNGTTRIIHQEAVVAGYTLIYDSASGWAMTPGGSGSAHAAVTLDANADTLLSLSTQALGLDTKAANLVFAGPTTGAAAVPTFRSLVSADIPALAYEASGAIASHAALITGVHGLVFTAGKALTLTESLTLNALPIGGLAVATGANALGSLAVGLITQVLVGGGAGTVPAWAADLPTAVTIGSGYIYRAGGTDVPVADGGTGASTLALNGVLFGNAANAIGATAIGAQYQVLTVGATPFAPAFSSFLLDGTSGGKTVLAVTGTKTLTLTSTDDYNLTIPATGTAALLNQANSFTLINPLTTIAESWIGPSSTTGIYFKSNNIGIGTTGPTGALDVYAASAIQHIKSTTGTNTVLLQFLNTGGQLLVGNESSAGGDAMINGLPYAGIVNQQGAYPLQLGTSNTARVTISTLGNVGIWTILPDRLFHAEVSDAVTNAITYAQRLSHITSGTAAAGFGTGIEGELEDDTGTNRIAAYIEWLWNDPATAAYKGDLILKAVDSGGTREGLRIRGSGTAPMIGFLGTAISARIAHVADANAAYGAGDLDTEAEIISALNTTNGKINSILATLEGFGFHATA